MTLSISDSDPYMQLVSMAPSRVSRALFPYLSQVRRASEWARLGYPTLQPKDDGASTVPKSTLDLWPVDLRQPRIVEAIETGLRAEAIPWQVFELLRLGASESEFVPLPTHVLAYCRGREASAAGNEEAAAAAYAQALLIAPNEVRYAERLFESRRAIGDAAAWVEEFSYYAADAEYLSNRLEGWLKFFIKRLDAESTHAVVARMRALMQALLDGNAKSAPRRYSEQSHRFHEFAAEKMERTISRQLERLEKAQLLAVKKARGERKRPRVSR